MAPLSHAADAVAWLSSMPGRSRLLTTTTFSLNGSSGFRIGVKSKPAPACLRRVALHDGAVRDVDRAEAALRVGRRLGQRREGRHHRVEQRQGDRRPHTRRKVRRGN